MQLGIFHDCKIGVTKTRSDYDVAAEASEARHCREYRSIEPMLDAVNRGDRSGYVGPEGVTDPIHGAVTGDDVNRAAALKLNDRRQLPTVKHPITAER